MWASLRLGDRVCLGCRLLLRTGYEGKAKALCPRSTDAELVMTPIGDRRVSHPRPPSGGRHRPRKGAATLATRNLEMLFDLCFLTEKPPTTGRNEARGREDACRWPRFTPAAP